mmetsp:Transcript_189/g.714  ORF Transcript_189/g.714 Transcript_189/m.714 type:complete len:260 (+) Transcript_189:22-801(+)
MARSLAPPLARTEPATALKMAGVMASWSLRNQPSGRTFISIKAACTWSTPRTSHAASRGGKSSRRLSRGWRNLLRAASFTEARAFTRTNSRLLQVEKLTTSQQTGTKMLRSGLDPMPSHRLRPLLEAARPSASREARTGARGCKVCSLRSLARASQQGPSLTQLCSSVRLKPARALLPASETCTLAPSTAPKTATDEQMKGMFAKSASAESRMGPGIPAMLPWLRYRLTFERTMLPITSSTKSGSTQTARCNQLQSPSL